MAKTQSEAAGSALIKIVIGIIGSVCVLILGGVGNWFTSLSANLNTLDRAVLRIESSRFTRADGAILAKEIADIKSRVDRLPPELPPKWVRDALAEHGAAIKEINRKIDRLQRSGGAKWKSD